MQGAVELTILMPCLDEAATVARCVEKARDFLQRAAIEGEVLVADVARRAPEEPLLVAHLRSLVVPGEEEEERDEERANRPRAEDERRDGSAAEGEEPRKTKDREHPHGSGEDADRLDDERAQNDRGDERRAEGTLRDGGEASETMDWSWTNDQRASVISFNVNAAAGPVGTLALPPKVKFLRPNQGNYSRRPS